MAFNCQRGVTSVSRQALRHCRGQQLFQPVVSARTFSSSLPRRDAAGQPSDITSSSSSPPSTPIPEPDGPRWASTPDRMKAPFSLRVTKDPDRPIWKVNEDPERLDQFYIRFLGNGGERLLPEEVKWLAVTHKTFDYGRRGFNTRLAYFGRQVLALEAMRYIMASQTTQAKTDEPQWRQPFEHPALANVDKLIDTHPADVISGEKLSKLAIENGLHEVVRWEPRNPRDLSASGITGILQGTVYAIVGAISLQHGGEVASKVCRERILKRLGS